jgi:hypothetical protein
MRDDDSDDTPVVLLRLPPERELPRCRCGAAYTIGVTTGPESEAYYCDDCTSRSIVVRLCRAAISTDGR